MAAGMAEESVINVRREREGDKGFFIMTQACQLPPPLATAPCDFPRGSSAANRGSLRTAANNGIDNRDFRKLNTTNGAVAPWIDAAGKFGKSGTTLWISFLARLATSSNSGNGGVHLYDGLGDLTLSADGDKANHERMFMGDRASGTFWFIGRTCGGCPCGVFAESTNTVNGMLHLFAYRYDF